MLTRRQFIKAGIVGGAALTAAGLFYSRSLKEAPAGAVPQGLTLPERTIIAALVPAILAGVLPAAGEARQKAIVQTVDGVGVAIAGLSAAAQKELAELFALLGFAPAARADRGFPAGLADEPTRAAAQRLCRPARPRPRRLVRHARGLAGHRLSRTAGD
ncbi:MAG: twin-arginine translocation signal domain-containing protein, partial [Rhodocyclaceae bacterium]|nr:twin-arginine translocation signal domain-containing protein [Rhodocyclaceae bacterium]